MKVLKISNYTIYIGAREAGEKFKLELSDLIKTRFPGPYNESNIKQVLNFGLDHYSKEFEKICRDENSFKFYRSIHWLHEQSIELHRDAKALEKLRKKTGRDYFPVYRRVLKLIIEQACMLDLAEQKANLLTNERLKTTFDDLMFLGDEIFSFANLLAEQDMIGDAVSMDFSGEGIYILRRNHYFDLAFKHIVGINVHAPDNFVIDKNAEYEFALAVKKSFKIDFPGFMSLLAGLFEQKGLKKWELVQVESSIINIKLTLKQNVTENDAAAFLSGLYFTKEHKIPINKVVRKPFEINRFLNRPLLVWNVDDKDYCIIGKYSMIEAIDSLFYNAFPWDKAPLEWKANQAFTAFLKAKKKRLEKMLLDKVEEEIKPLSFIYQLTIKKLMTLAGPVNIEIEECGEIDILLIDKVRKKIFVIECKHLLGRYDMANFYMDFNKFTKGDDSFNRKIEKKINWIKNNLNMVILPIFQTGN